MLKNEFILMQEQDLVTKNDLILNELFECFKEVLNDYPSSVEIDSKKSVEECYHQMEQEARKKAVNGKFCFGPLTTKKFIIDYLGLTETVSNFKIVNITDFLR